MFVIRVKIDEKKTKFFIWCINSTMKNIKEMFKIRFSFGIKEVAEEHCLES
jgi:hypothetical protein